MLQNFHLLDARTQVPVTQIQYLPNFLSLDEIDLIKQLAQIFEFEEPGVLGEKEDSNLVFRQSKVKWILWNDDNWWLYAKIMETIKDLNNQIWRFDLYGINEFLQYTEYEAGAYGRGHYDWHMDLAHEGIASNRKLSFECILEDQHEGGEFSVLLGPTEHKVSLNKGDCVIYPTFLMNKVYPVKSGKRSSIVSWIAGPAFK